MQTRRLKRSTDLHGFRIFPLPLSEHLNYGHAGMPSTVEDCALSTVYSGQRSADSGPQFDPPALAILLAAVGHHMARWRRMVVNAIGAGWIIVIGRALCADRVQFFLCNHAHVVSIGVLLARAVVVVHIVVVAVAVRGFSANGQRTIRLCVHCCCCHCAVGKRSAHNCFCKCCCHLLA